MPTFLPTSSSIFETPSQEEIPIRSSEVGQDRPGTFALSSVRYQSPTAPAAISGLTYRIAAAGSPASNTWAGLGAPAQAAVSVKTAKAMADRQSVGSFMAGPAQKAQKCQVC